MEKNLNALDQFENKLNKNPNEAPQAQSRPAHDEYKHDECQHNERRDAPQCGAERDALTDEGELSPAAWPQYAGVSAAEQLLLEAGITPAVLMAQWGVTLWSAKPKEGRLKLKVEARKPLDVRALEHWCADRLGQPVSVKLSDVSNCCHSPCKGCLWVYPEKRAFWASMRQPSASAPEVH